MRLIAILDNFQIFNEPIKFNAAPKIDAKNIDYKRGGGNIEVFKLLQLKLKILSSLRKSRYNNKSSQIFDDPVRLELKSKIDAKNSDYKKGGGDVKV